MHRLEKQSYNFYNDEFSLGVKFMVATGLMTKEDQNRLGIYDYNKPTLTSLIKEMVGA